MCDNSKENPHPTLRKNKELPKAQSRDQIKVFRGSDEVNLENWGRNERRRQSHCAKENCGQSTPFSSYDKWQVSQFGLSYVVHISVEYAH